MRLGGLALVVLTACGPARSSSDDAGAQGDGGARACLRLPEEIDFGESAIGLPVERRVVLTAPPRAPFTIDPLESPFSVTVHEGQNQLQFVFVFTAPDSRLHVGDFAFAGGPGCEPQTVRLRALGAGTLRVDAALDFGAIPVATVVSRTFQVHNTRRVPVDLHFSTEGPFSVQTDLHLEPLEAADVAVEAQLNQFGLQLATLLVSSSLFDTARVQLSARGGVPVAVIEPAAIAVDTLPVLTLQVGATRRTVRITNIGEGDLSFEGVTVVPMSGASPGELTASLRDTLLVPRVTAELELQFFAIDVPGPRSWNVQVRTNDPARRVVDIAVTAEVERVAPCALQVTAPATLVLGGGLPATGVVRLSNPNPQPCLVDDLRFSARGWSLTPSVTQLALDGGAHADLTVTSPATAGQTVLEFNTVGTAAPSRIVITAQ
jgi:hypothetical protein